MPFRRGWDRPVRCGDRASFSVAQRLRCARGADGSAAYHRSTGPAETAWVFSLAAVLAVDLALGRGRRRMRFGWRLQPVADPWPRPGRGGGRLALRGLAPWIVLFVVALAWDVLGLDTGPHEYHLTISALAQAYRPLNAALLLVWMLVGIGYAAARARSPVREGGHPGPARQRGPRGTGARRRPRRGHRDRRRPPRPSGAAPSLEPRGRSRLLARGPDRRPAGGSVGRDDHMAGWRTPRSLSASSPPRWPRTSPSSQPGPSRGITSSRADSGRRNGPGSGVPPRSSRTSTASAM